MDQASTSESDCEKCSVRSEVAMSDGERGVAMGPYGGGGAYGDFATSLKDEIFP